MGKQKATSRLLTALLTAAILNLSSTYAAPWRVVTTCDVDEVPASFPVNFSLLTQQGKHFVAYYDADRVMTVAASEVGKCEWQKQILPSRVGWDSHNYVALAADSEGQLHLSGNMHGVPLVYFRTNVPGDIATFASATMVGDREQHVTYPVFFSDADENLLFMYRDGGSGDGSSIVNRFDAKARKWSRFLDQSLFDGEGERNSYPLGPVKGVDGWFHLVWVWRDTPDCATNHHLSYVRSRDLKNWESADGASVDLPLRLNQEATWVDPIPSGGGIINGCEKFFLDSQNHPTIAYHKNNSVGNMQVFVARFEDGGWKIRAVTRWDKPVVFGGFGSMPFIGIAISDVKRLDADYVYIGYRHRDYGSGKIVLDESTLNPVTEHPQIETEYPPEITSPRSNWPGMMVHIVDDIAITADAKTKAVLRWETLETYQDRPREPPLPPPRRLQLVILERD